jgi:hypothetical protein
MNFRADNNFSVFSPFLVQVLKFLMEKNNTNALHGQVTIGTLILQVICHSLFIIFPIWTINAFNRCSIKTYDFYFFFMKDCAVGLLFALLPVLGGTSGVFQGVLSMTKL